jgi:hypothetical protein
MEFMDSIFLLSILPMASYKDSLSKKALPPTMLMACLTSTERS